MRRGSVLSMSLRACSVVQSCLTATPRTAAHQAPLSVELPSKSTGASCNSPLQGTSPTQGSSPRRPPLPYWRTDVYCATWEATVKSAGLALCPTPAPASGVLRAPAVDPSPQASAVRPLTTGNQTEDLPTSVGALFRSWSCQLKL